MFVFPINIGAYEKKKKSKSITLAGQWHIRFTSGSRQDHISVTSASCQMLHEGHIKVMSALLQGHVRVRVKSGSH